MTRDDGFTMVELLVVTLIVGILSAIAIPAFAAQRDKAKLASVKTTLRNAANAEEMHLTEFGRYAPVGIDVTPLITQGYTPTEFVTLLVVDDDMADAGHGFCLRAESTTLPPGNQLYWASSGPEAGRATRTACVAS